MSLESRQIAEPNHLNFHNNHHKKITDLLDTDEASLDMDHLDLQLNSLDKDLLDSRQKANWEPINFYEILNQRNSFKISGLDEASLDFQLKVYLFLKFKRCRSKFIP